MTYIEYFRFLQECTLNSQIRTEIEFISLTSPNVIYCKRSSNGQNHFSANCTICGRLQCPLPPRQRPFQRIMLTEGKRVWRNGTQMGKKLIISHYYLIETLNFSDVRCLTAMISSQFSFSFFFFYLRLTFFMTDS